MSTAHSKALPMGAPAASSSSATVPARHNTTMIRCARTRSSSQPVQTRPTSMAMPITDCRASARWGVMPVSVRMRIWCTTTLELAAPNIMKPTSASQNSRVPRACVKFMPAAGSATAGLAALWPAPCSAGIAFSRKAASASGQGRMKASSPKPMKAMRHPALSIMKPAMTGRAAAPSARPALARPRLMPRWRSNHCWVSLL